MSRREDFRLIVGRGRYTSDWNLPEYTNTVPVSAYRGAGRADIGEHAVYDPATAQLLTGSFMDYVMPRAGWLRDIRMHDHPVPTLTNALGAKGVGEAGCSGSLPALANAAVDALRPLGIKHLDMPFSPARLWEAMRRARGKGTSNA